LTFNCGVQLLGTSEINAVGNTLTLGALDMNGQTLSSYGGSSLNITGAISGTGTYNIKNQGLTVTYSGSAANTFTGTTTVENSSTLVLNKAANTAAIAGFLTINSGATVRTDNINQLNNQFVTVNGTLNLNGNAQSTALSGSGTVKLDGATSSGTLTINNTLTDTFSGTLTDNSRTDGFVVKTGVGTQVFSNANTYDGGTSVTGGTLLVTNTTGSGTGTGSVTVTNSGSVLSGGTTNGAGGISGPVNINPGATLAPGTSGNGTTTTAILHTGALTLVTSSNFSLNLNSTTAGTGYDQISVTGTVNVSGSNILVAAGGGLSIGDKFFVTLNDGTDLVTGTFAQGATVTSGADTFLINYLDNGDGGIVGNDISLTLTAVPEPSTWVAGVLAMTAVTFTQRGRLRSLFV